MDTHHDRLIQFTSLERFMIYRSPYPDLDIPNVTLTEFALQKCARRWDQPALIDSQTRLQLTYGELAGAIRRAAAGFYALGLRKGDVAAFIAPNSLEYVVAFHAVASLGGIIAPISPASSFEEIERHLMQNAATYLVGTPELFDRCPVLCRNDAPFQRISFGETPAALSLGRLSDSGDQPPHVEIEPAEDVVAIYSSSGTTGLPKGVELTHRAAISAALQSGAFGLTPEGSIQIWWHPLYHILGLSGLMGRQLASGATTMVMPRFDLASYCSLIQEFRVKAAHLVPQLLVKMVADPIVDRFDLRSLERMGCGTAPLSREIADIFEAKFGCRVFQGYGMTEIAPTHMSPSDFPRDKRGSVGVCTPGTECVIVDLETGLDVESNVPGEVLVRGPQMMRGYHGQPEVTAQTIDSDGWIHTGDLGYVDEDGYLFLLDRIKELIKHNGHQVAPAELEGILLEHPAVADAAVARAYEPDGNEVSKAFVVVRWPVSADELLGFVANRVTPFKRIRQLEFVDEIPRGETGKILRRKLAERDPCATASQV